MATALEAYYVDNNTYPACSDDPAKNVFGGIKGYRKGHYRLPTFMISVGGHPETLTTPVTYINNYFKDEFAPVKGMTFCYFSGPFKPDDAVGWLVWSPGPDRDYDITMDNIQDAYYPNKTVPSEMLKSLSYDPTNGSTSNGDIWRNKQ